MKFFLKLDENAEPSVTVVCGRVTSTVKQIQELCANDSQDKMLYGYDGDEIVPLTEVDITCFYTKLNKVFARVGDKEYFVKYRIKDLEENLGDIFIKINQGCLANVNQIKKFVVSIGGALKVEFKNGYTDYVSRRETVNIKRRFGL